MRRIALFSLILMLGAASAARAQVNLEARFGEGTTRTLQEKQHIHQVLTIAGTDVATDVDATVTMRVEAGQRMPDGKLRVKHTFQRIQMALDVMGMKVVSDTDNPGASKNDIAQLQGLLDAHRAMKGASYTLVLGKDNQLVAVEGLDEIIKAAPAGAADALKQELTQDRFKREAAEALGVLPGKAVKKGDKWQRTTVMEIGAGQTLKFETFYQYEGTVERGGETLDKISFFHSTVAYDLDPNSPIQLKVVKSDLKVDSSVGTVLWDRERGVEVERTGVTRITGPMTFSVNGMELEGKVDLSIDSGVAEKQATG